MTSSRFNGRAPAALAALLVVLAAAPLAAQDFSALRINEVIADNTSTLPVDFDGGTPDLLEIYNASDVDIELQGLAISDTVEFPTEVGGTSVYRITRALKVLARKSVTIFCDGQTELDCVEPHADFAIDSNGNEPISLWGPEELDGTRDLIDQVWLPPLRGDVSFGRFPDGAGPAPMPVEETFDWFGYTPKPHSSFGSCTTVPGASCPGGKPKRSCLGTANKPWVNLDPRVSRDAESTNNPAAGEAVSFVARVRDDKEPAPPNIASVEIVYRTTLEGSTSPWASVTMVYDAETGVQDGAADGQPLDRWTLWTGSIPGQPAGTRVEFYFKATDVEGLSSTRPLVLCEDGVGPCNEDFGGPGCTEDPLRADKWVPCETPGTYLAGYTPRGDLAALVINEVVANQRHAPTDPLMPATGILRDPSATDFNLCGFFNTPPAYCCSNEDPPTCGYDDYIEIYNDSDNTVDLSGLWLSDNFYEPRRWQFPANSTIGPRQHLLVWCDDDGSKCPDIFRPEEQMPGAWECPDPNDPANDQYHTNFELAAGDDQIFLFDNEANGFGLIHGANYAGLTENKSASLCPDGRRDGAVVVRDGGTPGAANPNECGPPPAPSIDAIAGASGPAGTVFTLTVSDVDEPTARVTVCDVEAAIAFVNPTTIEVTAPECAAAGCVAVELCTKDGCDTETDGFCYASAGPTFRRGDSNNDSSVDISDGVFTLNFLFQGGADPGCHEAANFNGDAGVDISDASATFNYLFLGGPSPSAPFPDCAPDPDDPTGIDCADSFCDR